MTIGNFLQKSILHRLQLVTALLGCSFVLIAIVLLVSFLQVRGEIDQIVQNQLQQTVENSRIGRVLTQFLVRQRALETSFVGHGSYLPAEGPQLQQLLWQLTQDTHGQQLQGVLLQLQGQFDEYLRQYDAVNVIERWRVQLIPDIDQALLFLEEIVADRMIDAAIQGNSIAYFEQLTLLISGYRVSMLEISKLIAEENHQQLQALALTDPPPLAAELDGLRLRLRTLTASEPPLNRLGQHLIDQVEYFQHLMRRFQQEMIYLGRQTLALDQVADQLLIDLANLDQQLTREAQQVSERLTRTIYLAGLFILFFLSVLAVLLGLLLQNLFRNHIQQPLQTIHQRLQRFQGGDYSSPLPLSRSDEWGQIESAFNAMLTDLLESWAAVHESKRRYHDIFVNASEGIFLSTLQGKAIDFNPAMAGIFGYDSPAEAIAAFNDIATQIYVQPGFREQLIEQMQKQGQVRNVEVRMRRRNGEIFWASLNAHLARDEQGNQTLMEGTLEDITAHRAAEESLRQLQNFLQDIIDSMPSILIGIDNNCQVTLWNKQAEQLCEVSARAAKGRELQQVFLLIATDSYLPEVIETLRSKKPRWLHKRVSEFQGQLRFFNLLIYPLTTTEASGAVIYIDEITERVKIEEVMVHSEKMLSVGGLAAGMAHEINNPLAAILQNAQVLSQRLSPALAKNRQTAEQLGLSIEQIEAYVQQRGLNKMLQSITESGQRAAKIVENMLSFSRKSTSSFIPQSLAGLVEQTLMLAASDYDLKHRFDFRSISIVRDFAPVPDVPCEASQIQQVILSLLKNAAQALSSKSVAPQITLRIFQRNGSVFLQVEDNGPGMSEEICKRAFEPFYTTKEVGSGTGLGLSVAYFIITQNHQGSLTVNTAPGEGSCFSLGLPLQRQRNML